MKSTENLQLVEYEPIQCKARDCGAILNPHCMVDFQSKMWTCPFCLTRNAFPPHYAQHINEQNLPAELIPMCSTIEYIIPQSVCNPPVFLMILDIALIEEELEQVKDSLQQSLAMMPQNALVGFITFGAMCYVHELSATALPKAYAFRGSKEYSAQQVAYQLGFSWPVGADRRTFRCTGAALSVAIGLLEVTYAQSSARVMLLTGGPCNVGPGMVVGEELSETIRSHLDLSKNNPNAKYTRPALKYYTTLATRAGGAGMAVDFFACSLDQVGLYEMRVLTDRTG